MTVTPVKTQKITPGSINLIDLLDKFLPAVQDGSVLAITSKIVSLCEGSVVPVQGSDKEELIKQESEYYLPADQHKYGYHFSVIGHTLISSAGIDESNGDGHYVLWPKDAQKTANEVWHYLRNKHSLSSVGVIITDSVSRMLRRGSTGTCLAHSGFKALKDYRQTKDLFGHMLQVSVANIAEGLASAAVVTMGEGIEQTPLALISDLPFMKFQDREPNSEELEFLHLTLENDYFEEFLNNMPWQKGGRA